MTSCKTKAPITLPIKTVERVTERLVPIEVPGDSAVLVALFECDSLNNVLLKDVSDLKGRQTATKIEFKNGRLGYRADFKPDTVYSPSVATEIEREVPTIVEVPVVEYRQTAFQNFTSRVGSVAILLLVLWVGYKVIKFRFSKNI